MSPKVKHAALQKSWKQPKNQLLLKSEYSSEKLRQLFFNSQGNSEKSEESCFSKVNTAAKISRQAAKNSRQLFFKSQDSSRKVRTSVKSQDCSSKNKIATKYLKVLLFKSQGNLHLKSRPKFKAVAFQKSRHLYFNNQESSQNPRQLLLKCQDSCQTVKTAGLQSQDSS